MSRTHRNHEVQFCAACGKLAHRDSRTAYAQRRSLIESGKHRSKSGSLKVYRCPRGNGWHVGHTGERRSGR